MCPAQHFLAQKQTLKKDFLFEEKIKDRSIVFMWEKKKWRRRPKGWRLCSYLVVFYILKFTQQVFIFK